MKTVCPRCKEVVLNLWDEKTIICTKCDTTFEVKDNSDEDKKD